jgi:uncharacterized protein YjiS (DUF1127 family)
MTDIATATRTRPATFIKFNPIRSLLRLAAAYREADQLKKTEGHFLEDMGISREQADTAFFQRFGQNRYYSRSR